MKRTPLRRVGARAKREQERWNAARDAVLKRGACERCTSKRMLEVHHVEPRARGGKHDEDNLRLLCWRCHRLIHDHACEDWSRWIR